MNENMEYENWNQPEQPAYIPPVQQNEPRKKRGGRGLEQNFFVTSRIAVITIGALFHQVVAVRYHNQLPLLHHQLS